MNQKDIRKLKEINACEEGIKWVKQFKNLEEAWNRCVNLNYMRWAVEKIKPPQKTCVELAVELAELVLPLFETKYPDDNRPRKAIEAAKQWLKDSTVDVAIADAAAYAAFAAYNAAADYTASDAAYVARSAARAAAYAACDVNIIDDAIGFAWSASAVCTYFNNQQICDIIRKHINPFKQNEETSN